MAFAILERIDGRSKPVLLMSVLFVHFVILLNFNRAKVFKQRAANPSTEIQRPSLEGKIRDWLNK